jgi:succinate dehydrogenase/fumarate reductase flavoprotein subunit
VTAGGFLGISPVVNASPLPKWDRKSDVVVIGSGIAGMSAAIEAADAGASVIVLEKDAQPGGLAILSGGHMTVAGTDVQARLKVEDKPDWLYADMMENSEMTAVPELVRKYVDNGPEQVRWLENLGVRFADYFERSSVLDQSVDRGHEVGASPDYPGGRPSGSGGLGLMLMLFRAAEKRGVSMMLEHKMTRLLQSDPRGPVIGVDASNKGKSLAIKAHRGVVIATGGYSGNLQMCMAEDPRLNSDIYPDGWPYHLCLGEGHIAAVEVGATLNNMSYGGNLAVKWGTQVYQLWEPPTFSTVPIARVGVGISDFQYIVLVKNDGKRYVNEVLGTTLVSPQGFPKFWLRPDDFPNHPFNEAYLNLNERPRNVWAVADAEGAKALKWQIEQIRKPDPKSGVALYPEMVAAADSLKDLAAKMGIDADGLGTTISRYNGFVEVGKDEGFGKPQPKHKIVQAPFYGAKLAMMHHTRRSGIRVNSSSQVIDRSVWQSPAVISIDNEKTIPHLYAAGECGNYLGRYHSHGTLGMDSFYGRVAGRNAAAEKST